MFKILVIDDDHNIRLFIKEALELNKYNVLTAKDAYEGFDILDDEDYPDEPNEWQFDDDPYNVVYYEFPDEDDEE